jgi:O-antigen/teichoic acid export membrane protein
MPDVAPDIEDPPARAPTPRNRAALLFGSLSKLVSVVQVVALADQIVVSGGTFLATVAVGRWADSYQLGMYTVAMTALISVVVAQQALVTLPLMIRQGRLDNYSFEIGGHSLIQSGALSAAAFASATLLAVAFLIGQSDASPAYFVGSLALLAPGLLLRDFARQCAFAQLRVVQVFVLDSVALVIQATGLLCLGISGQLTATTACITNSVAFGTVAAGWLYGNCTGFHVEWRRFRDECLLDWLLGRWLLAGQLASAIQAFVIPWLLALIDGSAEAGVYAACLTLVGLSSPIVSGFSNVAVPRMTRMMRGEGIVALKYQALRDTIVLGTVMVGFCGLITFTWGFVAHLLYRDATYAGHGQTLVMLALSTLVTAVGIPPEKALWCVEKSTAVFWVNLASVAVTTILGLWLIGQRGALGGAYGYLVGSLVGSLGRWTVLLLLTPSETASRAPPTGSLGHRAFVASRKPTGIWRGIRQRILTVRSSHDGGSTADRAGREDQHGGSWST